MPDVRVLDRRLHDPRARPVVTLSCPDAGEDIRALGDLGPVFPDRVDSIDGGVDRRPQLRPPLAEVHEVRKHLVRGETRVELELDACHVPSFVSLATLAIVAWADPGAHGAFDPSRKRSLDQPVLHRVERRAGPGPDADLRVDVLDVAADGLRGDDELGGARAGELGPERAACQHPFRQVGVEPDALPVVGRERAAPVPDRVRDPTRPRSWTSAARWMRWSASPPKPA